MFKWMGRSLVITFVLCSVSLYAGQGNPEPEKTPTATSSECGTETKSAESNPTEKNQLNCHSETVPQQELSAAEGENEALAEVERKVEDERLKVLFVDVNTVMETIGTSMDWTANWLDGYFADDEYGKNKAKAWGHVTFAWEPREGEMDNFPMKFKVRAKLPNLKNKMEIVISDNEQDDFNTLPYETVRPDALKSSQRSLGAAVRFLHATSENVKISSRIGTGEGTVYARSAAIFQKKYWGDKITLNTETALEYYVSDGWGGRVLMDTGYAFSMRNEVRFNIAYRDLESYDSPTWRKGIYHIGAVGEKNAFITGVTVSGEVEPYRPQFYKASVRYRFNALRNWIYFEIEPFVEFIKQEEVDPITLDREFVRDRGITFRFEAHYGFL